MSSPIPEGKTLVRFTDDYDYRPTLHGCTAYPKGFEGPVDDLCADFACDAGKAERVKPKAKPEVKDPDPKA